MFWRITIFSLLIFSCSNQERFEILDQEDEPNPFIGDWVTFEKINGSSASLIISPDSVFSFQHSVCMSSVYSLGRWKVKNGSIVLTSSVIDSCLFTREYGIHCLPPESAEFRVSQTSIKGCNPEVYDYYILFRDEVFILKNDSLIPSVNKDTLCPELIDVFYRDTNASNK